MMYSVFAIAALCTSATAVKPCLDDFTKGLDNVRVSEVCQYATKFADCLDAATLIAHQTRFGCPVGPHTIKRRQADGNADIDMNPNHAGINTVYRQRRETVSIFELNDKVSSVESLSAATTGTVAQLKTDVGQARLDINLIRTDMTKTTEATIAVARIDERVKVLSALSTQVDTLGSSISTLEASLKTAKEDLNADNTKLKNDLAKDADALETKLNTKIAAAVTAANAAKAAAAAVKITALTMPKGSVIQVTDRKNENPGGSPCSNGYCTDVPHYGNNMNQYRKTVCYIEITTVRANSHFKFSGGQYVYTIGGSHFYLDYKRQVNGGSEKSLLIENRKSGITDQISGGHPNRGLGIMMTPTFLDRKANAAKGAKVRYTLWVASWSSGRLYLHGYPNNNERSLNWYTLQEIAA